MSNNKKITFIKKREWWHLRKYYKSGHGALIVVESGPNQGDVYYFLNITKHPPNGYSYFETEKPINISNEKSFIRLYLQKGKKKSFSKWLLKYELTENDLDKVARYLEEKSGFNRLFGLNA